MNFTQILNKELREYGYYISADDHSYWLWHKDRLVAMFNLAGTVNEIRNAAEWDYQSQKAGITFQAVK